MSETKQNKVLIYTKDDCAYCVMAKKFLKNRDIVYEEIHLGSDFSKIDEVKEQTGWRTMPVILIDNKVIGGYTDLKSLEDEGNLNHMLGLE